MNMKKQIVVIGILILWLLCLFRVQSVFADECGDVVVARPCDLEVSDYVSRVFDNLDALYGTDESGKVLIENEIDAEPIIGEPEFIKYTQEDYDLLAHLIYAEAGSDWCSDKMQLYTGSVVLNRIADRRFPNTMREVIYQKGQYSVVKSGAINKTPNERAYKCAEYLLENGSVLPPNVIFQAQFIQGDGIYEKVQNMYFCYKN